MRQLCFAVVFALAGTAPALGATSRATDEAKLTQIKTDIWPGFYRRQDVNGLDAFLADVFVNIGPNGEITPKATELEGVRTSLGTRRTSATRSPASYG
jgi:hypothetical protein